jgi:O-acetyl-ADP-ribose deacetylase
MKIEIINADITQLKVDAIVNAANESLLGGGGVDGAIHQAAGHQLLEECKTLDGCKTGFAKITQGYNLPAKYVIHTVGPVWFGGQENEETLLKSCYNECMNIAKDHKLKSMAFPAISCGAFGFPIQKACDIALKEIKRGLMDSSLEHIIFACFSSEVEQALKTSMVTVR